VTIPGRMYQMAQDRQAELLREAAEYRPARPTTLVRISSRIPHFRPGRRPSRARVLGRSTFGLVKIKFPKRGHGCREATITHRFSRRS
jgi:hypothetical protein